MSQEILSGAIELFNQKKLDAALEKFEQCASDPACRPAAYYGMGCCYSYKYDIYNAKDCFEKVVGISPGSAESEVARAFIEDARQWLAGEIDFFSLSTDIQKAPQGSLCAYHEEEKEPAVYVCSSCHKPVCLQCTFPVAAKYYCLECGRTKEIEERRKVSFKQKSREDEGGAVKKDAAPKIRKTALHLGIYLSLFCVSLFYRFVLRDASPRNAGLVIVAVSGEMREERGTTAGGGEDARFSYVLKVKIKNSGKQAVERIYFQAKLYDTFGQRMAQKVVYVNPLDKSVPKALSPGQSHTLKVKFPGLRGNVARKHLRILSFDVQGN